MIIDRKIMPKIGWRFDNSYARLPNTFYTIVNATPVYSPKLIILNHALAASLGLDKLALQSEEGIEMLSGNLIPEDALPLAQAYAGHQFGHFTMLGDGRALLIGEQITKSGKRFDIQLKGSGKTPYSRGGDGRAALGPMLREYIISEAMHALGIPTTRSLAVVTTGETVIRETALPGAILTRVASSHLRVGTFQYAANWGTVEELRILADYAINRHFPEAKAGDNPYLLLLKEVTRRQASLVAQWQLVGFIHGVMNTDNMAISGEAIDFGPCAFMDTYDLSTVFSSIDIHGRYAYGNQPDIAIWNLARFAETLLPLLHVNLDQAVKLASEIIFGFADLYRLDWFEGMRAKLGLFTKELQDDALIKDLLNIMHEYHADYTNTFRALSFEIPEEPDLFSTPKFTQWHERWQARLSRQQESKDIAKQLMCKHNPSVIPRNYKVEEALEAAVKYEDYKVMERLLDVLANPFSYSLEQDEYATPPPPSSCPYQTFCGT